MWWWEPGLREKEPALELQGCLQPSGPDGEDGCEEPLAAMGLKWPPSVAVPVCLPATHGVLSTLCWPSWCSWVFLASSLGQAVTSVLFTCLSLPHPLGGWPFCPVLAGRPHCQTFLLHRCTWGLWIDKPGVSIS